MYSILAAVETVEEDNMFLAVSAAWLDNSIQPKGDITEAEDIKQIVITSATAKNKKLEKAINASIYRIIEKLYMKEFLHSTDKEKILFRVVLKPRYRGLKIDFPADIVRSHWLITASRTLLKEELRKEHVRYIRQRGSKATR